MKFTTLTAYGSDETYTVPSDLDTLGKMWTSALIQTCRDLVVKSLAGSFSDVQFADIETMNDASLRITIVDLAGGREGVEYTRADIMDERVQYCKYRGN